MSRPKLIIIQGAPASGKTTISRQLVERLDGVILLSKDDIKEFLFDTQPAGDREWSRVLGRASIAAMYAIAETILKSGKSVMLESAFDSEYARADIEALNVEVIEVFCDCSPRILSERFALRTNTTRHPGHLDDQAEYDAVAARKTYGPINVGAVITLDTAQAITSMQLERLIEQLTEFLEVN